MAEPACDVIAGSRNPPGALAAVSTFLLAASARLLPEKKRLGASLLGRWTSTARSPFATGDTFSAAST